MDSISCLSVGVSWAGWKVKSSSKLLASAGDFCARGREHLKYLLDPESLHGMKSMNLRARTYQFGFVRRRNLLRFQFAPVNVGVEERVLSDRLLVFDAAQPLGGVSFQKLGIRKAP